MYRTGNPPPAARVDGNLCMKPWRCGYVRSGLGNCRKTQYTFRNKCGPKSCETKALFDSVKWLFLWSWSSSWVNAIALFDLKSPQNLWEKEMWFGHHFFFFFFLLAVAEGVIDLKYLSGWSHHWVSCLTWGQGAEHTHPLQYIKQLSLRAAILPIQGCLSRMNCK